MQLFLLYVTKATRYICGSDGVADHFSSCFLGLLATVMDSSWPCIEINLSKYM